MITRRPSFLPGPKRVHGNESNFKATRKVINSKNLKVTMNILLLKFTSHWSTFADTRFLQKIINESNKFIKKAHRRIYVTNNSFSFKYKSLFNFEFMKMCLIIPHGNISFHLFHHRIKKRMFFTTSFTPVYSVFHNITRNACIELNAILIAV